MSKKKKVFEFKVGKEEVKPLVFIEATMKDGLLDYGYEIKTGVGAGNIHKVKGKGIFEEDLNIAFAKLNVHLAAIDDVFKHANVEINDIDKMRGHDLAVIFGVSGFALKGSDENLSVILKGHKRINSSGSWMDISTPKITLDKLSSYEWAAELKEAIEEAAMEVELYHGGKFTVPEEEEKADANQLSIVDEMNNEEFETAKIN